MNKNASSYSKKSKRLNSSYQGKASRFPSLISELTDPTPPARRPSSKSDAFDEMIAYWNSLPGVHHHKSQSAKMYSHCRKSLQALTSGTYNRSFDPDFISDFNIPSSFLDPVHKFTFDEIKTAMHSVSLLCTETQLSIPLSNNRVWPDEKSRLFLSGLSLPDIIYFKPQSIHTKYNSCSYLLAVMDKMPKTVDQIRDDIDLSIFGKYSKRYSPKLYFEDVLLVLKSPLTDEQKHTLSQYLLEMFKRHKFNINWRDIRDRGYSMSYLSLVGREDYMLPMVVDFVKFLQREFYENSIYVQVGHFNPDGVMWQRFVDDLTSQTNWLIGVLKNKSRV